MSTDNGGDGKGNGDDGTGNGGYRSGAGDTKVLIYDAENGRSTTTSDFIVALKKHLMSKYEDFQKDHDKHDEQRDCLYIIAVVRHTTPRIGETLNEVKAQLRKENVEDMRRVIVTYFYAIQSEDDLPNKIEIISKSDTFACIHLFDFIDKTLVFRKRRKPYKQSLKKINKTALQRIKTYIMQEYFKTEWSVNVFYDLKEEILLLVKQFLSELRKTISNSIQLQQEQPLKAPINVTSPTLIFIAECENDGLENLIKEDLEKVIIIKIIDFKKSTTSQENEQDQHYGETWEMINYKGNLKADLKFPKGFEDFVRTRTT